MIWCQCYVLKISSSPLGGGYFAPKNVKNPPYDSDFLNFLFYMSLLSYYCLFIVIFAALRLATNAFWSLGISRRTYGFALVRPCVRPCLTRYLEVRASDFSETWHKVASWRYWKKCSKRIFEKNSCSQDFGQKRPILPYLVIFSPKIRFLDIFFEFAPQINLVRNLGQLLWII